MERIKIEGSSNIVGVGYDEKELILEIEFKGGGVYRYLDVPVNVFNDFMESDSKGSFFHSNIKNAYGSTRA